MTSAHATPATQPSGPRPTAARERRRARRAGRRTATGEPRRTRARATAEAMPSCTERTGRTRYRLHRAVQPSGAPTGVRRRPVAGDARAFWLRDPGVGEIRPVPLPRPGPGRGAGAHRCVRGQPRHRDAGLPRRGAAEPARRDARAVPGGRLPRAGEVRLPQRRRRRAGPGRRCRAAPSSASTRTRPRTSCPADGGDRRCPTACPPARAVLAGTVETAVNALWDAAPLVGDRVAVVGAGHGRLLRRPAARPASRASQVTLVDVDPTAGRRSPRRSASTFARARPTRRATATSSCTPARPPPGLQLVARTCSAPRATVLELSWYGDRAGRAVARRGVPLAAAGDPGQPGRRGRAGPARSAARTRDRLALALDLLRDPAFDALLTGDVAVRRPARGDGRGSADGRLPALCHTHHLRRGWD